MICRLCVTSGILGPSWVTDKEFLWRFSELRRTIPSGKPPRWKSSQVDQHAERSGGNRVVVNRTEHSLIVLAATLAVVSGCARGAAAEDRAGTTDRHAARLEGAGVEANSAAFPFRPPQRSPWPFQLVVDRGDAGLAPANTRAAVEPAIGDGFEWIEVDVRRGRDGRHVLFHDAELDGKTNGTGLVSDRSLAELLQLDAGSAFASRYAGERLLSLDACLKLARRRINLYLDAKDVEPELLVRQVLASEMQSQVVVAGEIETLQQVRAASRGKVAVMPTWRADFGVDGWLERMRPDAVEIDAADVTASVCRAFRARGVLVQARTIGDWDRAEVWDQVLAAGADWIQTAVPEEVIAHRLWARVPERPVRIAMHRGASWYGPENTMPAFEKAIRLGADFVEFDVRTSADGKFFLLHDGDLGWTTDGRGAIAGLSSAAVSRLDAGSWFGRPYSGSRVPTLDEFLASVRGRVGLYFDAKDIAPEALVEALRRHDVMEDTVVYQSAEYLRRLRAVDARVRLMPPLGDPDDLAALAADLNPYAVDASWDILSEELIGRCHALGIRAFSDAFDHETIEEYQQAIRWGIDVIQTDYPVRVMRAIALLEPEMADEGNAPPP